MCQNSVDMVTNKTGSGRGASRSDASSGTRRYRKGKRARQQAETRGRIVEATMELYRTAGPADTTVTEVAKRAGVSRMTVYNHFPKDSDLIEACTDIWQRVNPLPNPEDWSAIDDPDVRTGFALAELYSWYAGCEDMVGRLLRDAPIVPALGETMRTRWWNRVDAMVDILSNGRETRGTAGRRVRAALRVALEFATWKTLTADGLDDGDAAEVAAGFVIVTDSSFAAS